MKKISSFLPQHVIDKRELLVKITRDLHEIMSNEIKKNITVISLKDHILTISCDDSSMATLIRFEKHHYITHINSKKYIRIDDIKFCLN